MHADDLPERDPNPPETFEDAIVECAGNGCGAECYEDDAYEWAGSLYCLGCAVERVGACYHVLHGADLEQARSVLHTALNGLPKGGR